MYRVSSTIAEIAINATFKPQMEQQFLASTIGCIVDITQPVYRQKQGNYIAEVKLIDETFNESTQSSYLIKYLSVYLISENIEEIKLTSKIGDFLYLHKFMFSAWNNIKLRAKYYGSFQCVYQIFSGEIEEDQDWKIERKMGKDNTSYNIQQLTMRIGDLKNWLRSQFTNVFRPFIGDYCSLIEPFTLVLKVRKIWNNQFQNYLFLTDDNKNSFYLDLKPYPHLLFRDQEWVYLRGVKQINTDKQIIFIESGGVIQLPQFFADQFAFQANYKAIYRKTNKLGSQKKQASSLTYITLFDQKISTIKQIFELQDRYQATSKKQEIILQNNYLVKGAVVKYTGIIKLYHTDYQMIVHDNYLEQLPIQQKKSTIEDRKLVYLFEGQLFVADKSITYKRECLKIMLFTNDSKSTFFDQKELQKLSNFIGFSEIEKRKSESLKVINAKLQKLKQLSSFESPATLVLEPIRSNKLIFRLINTKVV